MSDRGGSITERHILFALAKKIKQRFSLSTDLINFIKQNLKVQLDQKYEAFLNNPSNPFYEYDILNLLKKDLIPQFYLPANKECPRIQDVIKLADETGSIAAYAYLGDVENSVTGDKNAQRQGRDNNPACNPGCKRGGGPVRQGDDYGQRNCFSEYS